MCAGAHEGQKKGRWILSHMIWMLGTELEPFAIEASALSYWVFSSDFVFDVWYWEIYYLNAINFNAAK